MHLSRHVSWSVKVLHLLLELFGMRYAYKYKVFMGKNRSGIGSYLVYVGWISALDVYTSRVRFHDMNLNAFHGYYLAICFSFQI